MPSSSVFPLNPSKGFFVFPFGGTLPVTALGLTNASVFVIIGNGSITITSAGGTSVVGSQKSGGCIFAFSGSRPLYTSGSTVFPPQTDGQPSITLPCGEYLAHVYQYGLSHSMVTAATSSRPTPSQAAIPASLQASSKTRALSTTFIDTKLTGCYAGTGGSTVVTISKGYVFPTPLTYEISTKSFKTSTMPCSEFLTIHEVPSLVRSSFQRSPICTSYAQMWRQEVREYGVNEVAYPPGVVNNIGYNLFACCGGCNLQAPAVAVNYWSTAKASSCFRANTTITS